jgi:hypothetical protein
VAKFQVAANVGDDHFRVARVRRVNDRAQELLVGLQDLELLEARARPVRTEENDAAGIAVYEEWAGGSDVATAIDSTDTDKETGGVRQHHWMPWLPLGAKVIKNVLAGYIPELLV